MPHSTLKQPPLDTVAGDSLIAADLAAFSPTRRLPSNQQRQSLHASSSSINYSAGPSGHVNNIMASASASSSATIVASTSGESVPLLHATDRQHPRKKPFYRARPLWLVPFAITASLVRGMTLAPRVEVFTQLSCNRLHGHHNWNHTQHTTSSSFSIPSIHTALFTAVDPLGPHIHPSALFPDVTLNPNSTSHPHRIQDEESDSDDTGDPRRIPSSRCSSDPVVQAGAARLQTIMTTTMGLLSALTTGWWGHFGERHGRTRVLAIATFGLFLTDLTFILVSTPSSPLSRHGHKLLLVAPIIEGLLGGWSTLQSATSAYLSDCTSAGSRAHIFSRFTGVFYLGFSVGPSIGGWLIQHPLKLFGGVPLVSGGKMVTSVFWVAIWCSFINFILVLLIFPESLSLEKRERAMGEYTKTGGNAKGKGRALTLSSGGGAGSRLSDLEEEEEEESTEVEEDGNKSKGGVISQFLSPLAVFLPVVVLDPSGLGRKRRDWSLTLLAAALFGYMLSTGLYQIKYLYAVHMYGWGAEQLSYYISAMGGARAIFLLFLLPSLIGFFKPKPVLPKNAQNQKGKNKIAGYSVTTVSKTISVKRPTATPLQSTHDKGKKAKPTRAQLGQEIGFDLVLTRCSLMIDIVSHTLVAIMPAPGYKAHIAQMTTLSQPGQMSLAQSQAAFVIASSLSSMGSGTIPAIHSLALCVLQVRALDARAAGGQSLSEGDVKEEGTGALFGALAVLQAVGQMILGPMLFGLVYSGTVAEYPKAIFVAAAAILVCSLVMVFCVRNPVRPAYPGRGKGKNGPKRRASRDVERGRSRMSKDLRGGAVCYYSGSTGSQGANSYGSGRLVHPKGA